MKIAYSDVTMQSDRYYRQSGVRPQADTSSGSIRTSFLDGLTQTRTGSSEDESTKVNKNDFPLFKTSSSSNTWNTERSELTNMRDNLLQNLWQLLFGGSSQTPMRSLTSFGTASGLNSFGSFALMGSTITQTQVNYSEEEYTSFDAKGLAMTEDGRQLDFNISVSMSRSFMDYTQVQIPNAYALMDPLMVNVGSSVANISDQKFTFDLDADGVEEEISMPGAGTGFLALDKNGDGVINDGSELFGALTGDGFGDLRQYDDDGNGWIDENDEIFSKLKVWYKNGDGEDELVDLLSADIGAIYLGSQQTDFSLYSQGGTGDFMNAMIRATGFFLRESGGAGTVQHVDLAARIPGTADAEHAEGAGAEYGIGATLNAQGETGDATVVKASDLGLQINRTDNSDNNDTKIEKTASERRAEKAQEAKTRREKQIAKRKEEKERLDALFEERAEARRKLREELHEAQYERRLEEEALAEETASDTGDAVDVLTESIQEELNEGIQEEVTDETTDAGAIEAAETLQGITESVA